MTFFPSFTRWCGRFLSRPLAALLVVLGIGSAHAQTGNSPLPPGGGSGKPGVTLEQIVEAKQARRDAGTRLSGSLHQAVAAEQRRAGRSVTARVAPFEAERGPASPLHRSPDGRLLVTIQAEDVESVLPALLALGFEETGRFPHLGLVEGAMGTEEILALDELDGVIAVTPVHPPLTRKGLFTSETVFVSEAERFIRAFPFADGSGVRIGVLSDSYNRLGGAAAGVASGDLPAGVLVLQEGPPGSSDEGRAMMELIHDIAPGSELAFATAFLGQLSFAQNILRLADPADGNCQVVVDDVFYLAEPVYQDSLIGQAIDTVVAQGATYMTAVGNTARNAWEVLSPSIADIILSYRMVNMGQPAAVTDAFQQVVLPAGQTLRIALHWSDPHFTTGGVQSDLDLILWYLDSNNVLQVAAASVEDNIANNLPVEILTFTNPGTLGEVGFFLSLGLWSGPMPDRVKYIQYAGPTITEYATNSPTANPRGSLAGGMQVGAVNFFEQDVKASFTSPGPLTVLFEPDGTPLGAPETRVAPKFAAPQGNSNTFFGSNAGGTPTRYLFFGTSAAAPNAAAMAALMLSADPTLTPAEIEQRLVDNAVPMPLESDADAVGAGLVNVWRAFQDGQQKAIPQVYEDAYRGYLPVEWQTSTGFSGNVRVRDISTPGSGLYHVLMDSSWFVSATTTTRAYTEATLRADPGGLANIELSWTARNYNAFANPPDYVAFPSSYSGRVLSDGVSWSVDGTNWFRIQDHTNLRGNGSHASFGPINLSTLAAAQSIDLSAEQDLYVRFQRYGYGLISANQGGMSYDQILLTAPAVLDSDFDGVPDAVENARPGGTDGNDDTVSDVFQGHVASVPSALDPAIWFTIESDSGTLRGVRSLDRPDPDGGLVVGFPAGFVAFDIADIDPPGSEVLVRIISNQALPAEITGWAKYGALVPGMTPELVPLTPIGDTTLLPTASFVDSATTRRVIELRVRDGSPGDFSYAVNGWIRDPGGPGDLGVLLVDLESLTATVLPDNEGILIEWETSAEIDNVGFHIHRQVNGVLERLTPSLIPAEGDEFTGATYSYLDASLDPAWDELPLYFLEDVDLNGTSTFHGPASYREFVPRTRVPQWVLFE